MTSTNGISNKKIKAENQTIFRIYGCLHKVMISKDYFFHLEHNSKKKTITESRVQGDFLCLILCFPLLFFADPAHPIISFNFCFLTLPKKIATL